MDKPILPQREMHAGDQCLCPICGEELHPPFPHSCPRPASETRTGHPAGEIAGAQVSLHPETRALLESIAANFVRLDEIDRRELVRFVERLAQSPRYTREPARR